MRKTGEKGAYSARNKRGLVTNVVWQGCMAILESTRRDRRNTDRDGAMLGEAGTPTQ
jgi:hypothetical protein